MKILSRNVNGIRAVMKKDPSFVQIMQHEDPDIVCLQETKAFAHQKPVELGLLPYSHICRHAGQRPGYAGTAILSKDALVSQCSVFDHSEMFHEDGRLTQVELDDFILINGYFPNGGTRADGTEMLSYKLRFYDELTTYVQSLQKPVAIVGDFNICHTRIDIARPDANANSIGFLPEERERIGRFMRECGVVDIFRHFEPETVDEYTRWSYRGGARSRNVGRRIDYAMVSQELINRVVSYRHRQDIMGSDHCPVELVIG